MIILQVIIFLEVISKKQQSSTTLREKENEKNVSFSLFEIVLYRDQFGTPCVCGPFFDAREARISSTDADGGVRVDKVLFVHRWQSPIMSVGETRRDQENEKRRRL